MASPDAQSPRQSSTTSTRSTAQPTFRQTNIATRVNARVIASVAFFMLLCAVILAVAAPLAGRTTDPAHALLLGLITSVATLGLTEVFRLQAKLTHAEIGLTVERRTPLLFIAGFASGASIAGLWALLCALSGQIKWHMTSQVDSSAIGLWLGAYVALAMREGLAFHAYPLWRLRALLGLWPAQIAIAVVFALEHRLGGMSWTQAFLGAGVGSLLFGMASFAGRGIALAVGMHAAWNLVHGMLGMKGTPGVWTAAIEPGREHQVQIIAMTAYVFLFTAATAVLGRLEHRNWNTGLR